LANRPEASASFRFLTRSSRVVQVDREAGLAGRDRQGDRQHGLADPGWTEEADVGARLDELEGGQVVDLAGVQLGLEGEVEAVQALVVGQARELEGVGEASTFPDADLLFEDQVEELQIAHGLLLGPGDQLVEVLAQVRQVQPLGVLADAGGDQFTHPRPPARS
jgi:hypothetical protein